jgi:bZIP transcription factor
LHFEEAEAEYSPTPGADMSSQSSPGSASDHMGIIPGQLQSSANVQPLHPGASVLAAFEAGSHVNRVITTMQDPVNIKPRRNGSGGTGTGPNRRQKRLQRNRESARLSRRRRKHYLEELEERVDKMSEQLDSSRRQHIAEAVTTTRQKRIELILHHGNGTGLPALETTLARTSDELMVSTTFQSQQLKSFSVPPSMQFILWLTLQTDAYFRGGRAASERLSAARIGERVSLNFSRHQNRCCFGMFPLLKFGVFNLLLQMLSSGTNQAAPSQSMWPLFCNEVGLSYDQEEKLRAFQRTLLQDQKSWLDRHTAYSSRQVMQSAHDSVQALTLRAGQRERSAMSVLSEQQRFKLLAWSTRNRDRVTQSTASRGVAFVAPAPREIDPQHQHVAANLYILNERLQHVLQTVPRAAPLVTGAALKKLSRRPSFEPLGASDEKGLCREGSFASSGSLKRNASEMSMDDDEACHKPQIPSINPVDAQSSAAPAIQQALGMVLDLLPPPPAVAAALAAFIPFQISTPVPVPSLVYQAPAAYTQSAPSFGALHHERKSSFLPAHLNVVPEEMWPADEADEFLLDMIEGDWAIGEGIDMDIHE